MAEAPVATQEALVSFLAKCDPATPARAEFYVSRPQAFAPWLTQALDRVEAAKLLVIGQAGVGKSTELARLTDTLGPRFTLVTPPVDQILDLNVAGWHDILTLAALCSNPGPASAAAIALGIPGAIAELESTLVAGISRPGVPKPTGIQAFRNAPEQLHERIESGRAQFWDRAVNVFTKLSRLRDRPVLLVLDGLEKLSSRAMDRLFDEERRHILELPFRTVVTAPLAMSFQPYFGEVEAEFLAVSRLRALSHRSAEPGFRFLWQLAERRGALRVMDPELLEEIISWSGGLPRQLLQLLLVAATQSLTDGLSHIVKETLIRARRKASERWQYQLEPRDYQALAKNDQQRTAGERSRLLLLGALLEYDQPEGGLGLGINPLIGTLLKQRTSGKT